MSTEGMAMVLLGADANAPGEAIDERGFRRFLERGVLSESVDRLMATLPAAQSEAWRGLLAAEGKARLPLDRGGPGERSRLPSRHNRSMSQTLQVPDTTDGATLRGRWMTVIFNNEHNSMDEVVEVLMRATGCDEDEAAIEMWEAHHYGKAPLHFASREACEQAAGTIERIGVQTEVTPEWDD